MNDNDMKEAAQYVGLIVFVCLILGGAFLVGEYLKVRDAMNARKREEWLHSC